MPLPTFSRRGYLRRPTRSGGKCSIGASTACARLVCEYYDGFSFGRFIKEYPHLRGKVTDLLIGDLFDDKVDEVWGPLETLYPPDKSSLPAWDAGMNRRIPPTRSTSTPPEENSADPPVLILFYRLDPVFCCRDRPRAMLKNIAFYVLTVGLFVGAVLLILQIGGEDSLWEGGTSSQAGGDDPAGLRRDGEVSFSPSSITSGSHCLLLIQLIVIVGGADVRDSSARSAKACGHRRDGGRYPAGPVIAGDDLAAQPAVSFSPRFHADIEAVEQVSHSVYVPRGIDLDLRHLRKNRRGSFLISHASIVVPFFLGATLCLFIYPILASISSSPPSRSSWGSR
ncbi:MAG: hypothetical protein U0903_06855 [Planctomycetales bacterium]